MNKVTSALVLEKLVFENILFNRNGFKNDNEIEFEMEVQIGVNEDKLYKVTLVLKGDKKGEYEFDVRLAGIFSFEENEEVNDELKHDLISKNAVAIMMPYLRSEVSLLTAQPETECVVLPPFNINKMLEQSK